MKRFFTVFAAILLFSTIAPLGLSAEDTYPVIWLDQRLEEVAPFTEGLAGVSIETNTGRRYGFLDTTGKEAIPFIYNEARAFNGGLAAVKKDGKYGFIDKTGKVVVEFKYDYVEDFQEGVAKVTINNKDGFIDKTGKVIVNLIYDSARNFKNGMALVGKGQAVKKYGFINKTGKEVVPLIYDSAGEYNEGMASVTNKNKWGCVNTAGKVVIPLTFDGISNFSGGVAPAIKGRKFGVINKSGKAITPYQFECLDDFSEGLAFARISDKEYGYINTKGKFVIKGYNESWFCEGLAKVGKDGQLGFIDKTGKIVVPFKYGYGTADVFHNGFAKVSTVSKNYNYKYGFVDKTGKQITSLIYDEVFDFNEGFACVSKDNKFLYIDKTGKEVTPSFNGGTMFSCGAALLRKDYTWGIIYAPGTKPVNNG